MPLPSAGLHRPSLNSVQKGAPSLRGPPSCSRSTSSPPTRVSFAPAARGPRTRVSMTRLLSNVLNPKPSLFVLACARKLALARSPSGAPCERRGNHGVFEMARIRSPGIRPVPFGAAQAGRHRVLHFLQEGQAGESARRGLHRRRPVGGALPATRLRRPQIADHDVQRRQYHGEQDERDSDVHALQLRRRSPWSHHSDWGSSLRRPLYDGHNRGIRREFTP